MNDDNNITTVLVLAVLAFGAIILITLSVNVGNVVFEKISDWLNPPLQYPVSEGESKRGRSFINPNRDENPLLEPAK